MAIIDVIKFDGIRNRDWLVYKYPGNNFSMGSRLIVGEGQVAVFVKGGKALDFFTAGTYVLSTENTPILKTFMNIPFGGRTPFSAEVVFINKTAKLDMRWGTPDPISIIDCKYSVRLRVRAFGQFAMRISDYRLFLTELIGAIGDKEYVKYDLVSNYFRGIVATNVKTIIASILIDEKISVLDITPRLESISKTTWSKLKEKFEKFGIDIINFQISSINFPDEDFEGINNLLHEKAAFDIIGDQRYNTKRTFDVMNSIAENEGGGSLATGGMGLGLGAAAFNTVLPSMNSNIKSVVQPLGNQGQGTITCKKCGSNVSEGIKFCPNCGSKVVIEKIRCYSCNEMVEEGMKFCPNCGGSLEKKVCPKCEAENPPNFKFCCSCGSKLEE